jgi:hypothetical protein
MEEVSAGKQLLCAGDEFSALARRDRLIRCPLPFDPVTMYSLIHFFEWSWQCLKKNTVW